MSHFYGYVRLFVSSTVLRLFGQPSGSFRKLSRIFETIRLLRPYNVGYPLIRIGSGDDGGYLVPDDLAGLTACFSPGVDKIAEFEEFFADNYQIPCFLADASVETAPVENPMFHFERVFLGAHSKDGFVSLDDWVLRNAPKNRDRDFILQMDIEGAEYEVISNASRETLQSFRIIVIEFHNLWELNLKKKIKDYNTFFKKLTQDHVVVHLHPNNVAGDRAIVTASPLKIPNLLEVTLIRRDRIKGLNPQKNFPHPLDNDNVREQQTVTLPRCWYADIW